MYRHLPQSLSPFRSTPVSRERTQGPQNNIDSNTRFRAFSLRSFAANLNSYFSFSLSRKDILSERIIKAQRNFAFHDFTENASVIQAIHIVLRVFSGPQPFPEAVEFREIELFFYAEPGLSEVMSEPFNQFELVLRRKFFYFSFELVYGNGSRHCTLRMNQHYYYPLEKARQKNVRSMPTSPPFPLDSACFLITAPSAPKTALAHSSTSPELLSASSTAFRRRDRRLPALDIPAFLSKRHLPRSKVL